MWSFMLIKKSIDIHINAWNDRHNKIYENEDIMNQIQYHLIKNEILLVIEVHYNKSTDQPYQA